MFQHAYFDLRLHDDAELGEILSSAILSRETIHEWPLSCVQRVHTVDGREVVYKSQRSPSVEPDVYATAQSDLLPAAETVYRSSDHACMVIEVVCGPLVADAGFSEKDAVALGRDVIERIQRMATPRHFLVDVSTEEKWGELVLETVTDIRRLVDRGTFTQITLPHLARIEGWAVDPAIRAAIRARPGYLHGDLTGDNLFVLPGGPRVIDWQYPKLGPVDVDLATLLDSLGFDPARHVDPAIVLIMYFLRIQWFVGAAVRWFPPGAPTYDVTIASVVERC